MKNHRRVFILLCCQIVLSLFCFNISKIFAEDAPPKKPDDSLLVVKTLNTRDYEEPALFRTIIKARNYIVEHQNQDGGWSLIPGEKSDVEITALAIWALTESGWGTGSIVIRRGVRYLKNKQHEDGSWNNNTAHTTFALVALANAKTDPDARFDGLQWLKNAQNPSGSWGRTSKGTGHVLYTSATLAGLKKLGFIQKHFKPIPMAMEWLEDLNQRNYEGYWTLPGGTQSDIFATSWALQGLSTDYNLDEHIAWVKQFQNKDGGFPRFRDKPSDPEVTAATVMALAAYNDPLNTLRIAISYFTKAQKADGSFVSDIPMELNAPVANLQSTCFVLIAIHAKTDSDR